MKLHPTVAGLLNKAGAYLVRQRKHLIFKLPSGQTFVASSTPSDGNAYKAQVRDLKKLGLVQPAAGTTSIKRSKKPGRHGADAVRYDAPFNSGLAAGLSRIGLAEAALREQLMDKTAEVAELQSDCKLLCEAIDDYRDKVCHHEETIAALTKMRHDCWCCRIRDWWGQR